MATEWFYYLGNQRLGSVSSQQLKDLARTGQLQPDNLVWKEGMAKPQPASKLKGLFEPPSIPSTTPIEETKPPIASEAGAGDSAADAGSILAELGHAIQQDFLNVRRAVSKHLQPTAKPARQLSESQSVDTVGQTKQPGFVESLKTAGTLAAKQADLARIKNVSLSAAFQKLGKSVFEGNIGRAELKPEYATLDDLRNQITAKAEIAKNATSPQGFAEQAKAMAKATADAAQTKMLQMRFAQAITRLGNAAFEHRAEIALSKPLVDDIEAVHLQIAELEADIQRLCDENPDQKLGTSLADNPLIHLLAIPLCGLGFVLVFRSSYWSRKAKYRWAAGLIGFLILGMVARPSDRLASPKHAQVFSDRELRVIDSDPNLRIVHSLGHLDRQQIDRYSEMKRHYESTGGNDWMEVGSSTIFLMMIPSQDWFRAAKLRGWSRDDFRGATNLVISMAAADKGYDPSNRAQYDAILLKLTGKHLSDY